MKTNVRYRVGKNELVGKNKELDIADMEDLGIECVELRWIRTPRIGIYTCTSGFEDFVFVRNRFGDRMTYKKVRDQFIRFLPDERHVGYAYIPKTDWNMKMLAGMMKNKIFKPTDPRILSEIEEIQNENHFVKKINLRDKTMDAILSIKKRKEDLIVEKNEALKKELAVLAAEKENADLEAQIAAMKEEKEEKVKAAESAVEEPKTEKEEKEPVKTPQKRVINTDKIKRRG